jgi:hypothetical protein
MQVSEEYGTLFTAALSQHLSIKCMDETTFNHNCRVQLDPFVFDFMKKKYGKALEDFWNTYEIPKESDKAILIVERRCNPNLLFCIQNAVYFCRNYSLHIFCSLANFEFVKLICGPQMNNIHIHVQFDSVGSPQQGLKEYNQLLREKSFWEQFKEEHLITIECDSYFLKPLPESIYNFDYVASRWTWLKDEPGGGGLSYRRKSMMVRICEECPDGPQMQDSFASDGVRKLGYKFPTQEENMLYFTEAHYSIEAIGTHQWWTYCSQTLGDNGSHLIMAFEVYTTLQI